MKHESTMKSVRRKMKFHATMMKFRARIKVKFHAAIKVKFHAKIRGNFTLRSKWNFRAWFDQMKGCFHFLKKCQCWSKFRSERAGSIIHVRLIGSEPKFHTASSWSCDSQRWARLYKSRSSHFRRISIPSTIWPAT